LTDRKLLLGQLLDIKMKLPDATGPVGCAGRVVRVHENGSGRYEAGISIDRIGPLDRTRLVRFLRGEKTPITSERTGVA
jgi:Lon protease-like protein